MRRAFRSWVLAPLLVVTCVTALPSAAAAQARDDGSRSVQVGTSTQHVESDQRQQQSPPHKRRDPIWNGLVLGAGAGALLGLIPDHYDDCDECHDSLYASIAVGAGIGVLIDWLRPGPSAPTPSLKPNGLHLGIAVNSRTFGVAGKIVWR